MRRKIVSIVMASAMVLGLAACGSSGGTTTSSSNGGNDASAADDTTAKSESSDVVEGGSDDDNTLTVWTWDPNFNVYAIQKAAEIYAQDHEGFKVEVSEVQSDDIETRLTTAVSAGDLSTLPDIFLMQDNSFQKYATNYPDIFTDLTDSGIDFSEFSSAKVAYSTLDGKNYGIPFDNGAVIECLRTDMLEQAGFTVDDFTDITWNDFMEKAKVVKEKTGTAVSAGDLSTLPDIFLMQDNSFQKYATNYPDIFTDLTDSGIDFSEFSSAKVAYSTLDGKNYGIPFDNGAVIECLRTDMLEQAGFTVDDFTDITWNDFMEKAKVVKEKTGQPILTSQAGSPDLVMEMLQSCGESLFNEDGSVNIVDNKALKPILEIYSQMVKDGTLVEVTDWDQYIASINNGTTAGVINGCWIMASITANEDQSGKWALTNMPKLDGIDGATNYSNNGGSSWAISSNCKKTDLAIDFMKSTFAGSTALYDDIIAKGALATWAPAGDSEAYAQPVAFFSDDPVYAKIVDFATKTPSNITGAFYYDARDAVGTALSNIIQTGADMDSELQTAQETVEFNMGN